MRLPLRFTIQSRMMDLSSAIKYEIGAGVVMGVVYERWSNDKGGKEGSLRIEVLKD